MIARIIKYDPEKFYGFAQAQSGRNVFFHVSDWLEVDTQPAVGMVIEFELGPSGKVGKPDKAVNIRIKTDVISAKSAAGFAALLADVKTEVIAGVEITAIKAGE